ncbi:MAG: hypothetical protein R3240_07040 [Gammaproteobacteria bacterium]|nr:hypothetical protein [Gammaproteobacteria bacterium]
MYMVHSNERIKWRYEEMISKYSRVFFTLLFLALISSQSTFAMKGQPNFSAAIYADGEEYGTKVTTVLPAPNENNLQSFDKLFVITNSNNPEGQLPVSEAAPGNPNYNGGRWFTHTVEWTNEGFLAHGIVPVLKSMEDIHYHHSMGHLVVTPGSFPGGPPVYFQCPLLPTK